MGVSEEKREELVQLIADTNNYLSIEMAEKLANQIIRQGWQWHPKPIADRPTTEEVELIDDVVAGVPVKIIRKTYRVDDDIVAITNIVTEPLAEWEKELLYSPYDEDSEWKFIPQLPSVEYVINRAGIIMNRTTGETIAPSFHQVYLQWEVIVEIDGTKYHFLPERIAEELFDPVKHLVVDPPVDLKKVSERIEETQGEKIEFIEPTWVRIPKFEDYEVNSLGVVRNFWTKRVLGEYAVDPNAMVELHGSDGSPFMTSLQRIMDKTFGDPNKNSWKPED